MSDESWRYSFGKYLELAFYHTKLCCRAVDCPHDIIQDHISYFSLHNLTVRFELDPVVLFEIAVPPMHRAPKPELTNKLRQQDLETLRLHIEAYYDSVIQRIDNFTLEIVAVHRIPACKDALIELSKRAISEKKLLLQKLQETFVASSAGDYLALNAVVCILSSKIALWDAEFASFVRTFLQPEQGDVRRVAVQIKRMFADRDSILAEFRLGIPTFSVYQDNQHFESEAEVASTATAIAAAAAAAAGSSMIPEHKRPILSASPGRQISMTAMDNALPISSEPGHDVYDNFSSSIPKSFASPAGAMSPIDAPLELLKLMDSGSPIQPSESPSYSPNASEIDAFLSRSHYQYPDASSNNGSPPSADPVQNLDLLVRGRLTVSGGASGTTSSRGRSAAPTLTTQDGSEIRQSADRDEETSASQDIDDEVMYPRHPSLRSRSRVPATNPLASSATPLAPITVSTHVAALHSAATTPSTNVESDALIARNRRHSKAQVLADEDDTPAEWNEITGVTGEAERASEHRLAVPHSVSGLTGERGSIMRTITSLWNANPANFLPIVYPFNQTEHIFPDSLIVVREDEPSSIIAFTLGSRHYKEKLISMQSGTGTDAPATASTAVPPTSSAVPSSDDSHQSRYSIDFDDQFGDIEETLLRGTGTHIRYQFWDGAARMHCKVFFAEQFDALRRNCGADEHFVQSLSRCVRWDASGGRSGSTFLKTRDDWLVVKQLSRLEMDALYKFAPEYFEYMSRAFFHELPTVLAKIFGFYRIGFKNPVTSKTVKMDLLVMENLFYNRNISRIFDLKGSMRNRHVQSTGRQNEVLMDENLIESWAIKAFNVETALIRDIVSESAIGAMRLQWWRDGIESTFKGTPPNHPVLMTLAKSLDKSPLSQMWFKKLLAAREANMRDTQFATLTELETYAENTSSALINLHLEALGVRDLHAEHAASHGGKAIGIVTAVRATPHNVSQRRFYLPAEIMAQHGIVTEQVFRTGPSDKLSDAIFQIATRANDQLLTARSFAKDIQKESVPALLPLVCTPLIAHFTRQDSCFSKL
eukprot:jgi/Hompol1/6503/HPOL_002385-RA